MHLVVVTPCRNVEDLIGDTVRSIVDQTELANPDFRLTYVVVDGASTDGTLDIVNSEWRDSPSVDLRVISEPDDGMYDALAKGFAQVPEGDVYAYLNAGDMYSRHCFAVVSKCFSEFGVRWLTGMRVKYSAEGAIFQASTPVSYQSDLLRGGYYGIRPKAGRFIQQESTFWSGSLMQTVDLDGLRRFRLAGDFFLWETFSRREDLATVHAHLGGFRFHEGQLSEAMDRYRSEAADVMADNVILGRPRIVLRELVSRATGWTRPRRRTGKAGLIIAWSECRHDWVTVNARNG